MAYLSATTIRTSKPESDELSVVKETRSDGASSPRFSANGRSGLIRFREAAIRRVRRAEKADIR